MSRDFAREFCFDLLFDIIKFLPPFVLVYILLLLPLGSMSSAWELRVIILGLPPLIFAIAVAGGVRAGMDWRIRDLRQELQKLHQRNDCPDHIVAMASAVVDDYVCLRNAVPLPLRLFGGSMFRQSTILPLFILVTDALHGRGVKSHQDHVRELRKVRKELKVVAAQF